MRETFLLFLITVLILLLGIFFGFSQLGNSYGVSQRAKSLAVPFESNLDLGIVKVE
jgi:hypothetical protein